MPEFFYYHRGHKITTNRCHRPLNTYANAPNAVDERLEGPQKKIDGAPLAFTKFQTHPPTTPLFF
jgi:hypothetical protein